MPWPRSGFITTGRRRFLGLFPPAAALLTICHPPTAIIVAPVCAGFVSYQAASQRTELRRLAVLGGAVVLAAGLSAFFVVPAVAELDLVQIARLKGYGLDYAGHFLYPRQWLYAEWRYGESIPGPRDRLFLRVDRVQLASLVTAVCVATAASMTRRLTSAVRELRWWLAAGRFGLFMSTHVSAAMWETVPRRPSSSPASRVRPPGSWC